MTQQPKPTRIIIRKLLRTEDDILKFCRANKSTILSCGQFLYCFPASEFSEATLRWYATNDNLDVAFDCFGCIKLNATQIGELLNDWEFSESESPTPC